MIETKILPVEESCPFLRNILKEKFNVSEISPSLDEYFDKLKKTLWVFIEYPYVDRLYRDSFYHYFASKLFRYDRNTIRISFFEEKIEEEDFRNMDRFEDHLQKHFCGFLIVRPIRKCVGRNVLSPRAFNKSGIGIRTAKMNITVNGVKLNVDGFPHCSQDGEAMSCAETTVWSLVEYFGTRYPEYNSVLPSMIRNLLNQYSNERLLPSSGLDIGAISYLIKKLGFGSKRYSKDSFESNEEYFQTMQCYIESGIPIILCLTKEQAGHAAICIGRKSLEVSSILEISPVIIDSTKIYNINAAARELVIIDDNHPPYQLAFPEEPVKYYDSLAWKGFEIGFFIVPLHQKIYLEASQSKEFLYAFLESGLIELPKNRNLFIRQFLTTGRSLKFNICKNKDLNRIVKEYIIALELPNFVWVAEISHEEDITQEPALARGLVLFDATETDFKSMKALIFAVLNDQFLEKSTENPLGFKNVPLPLLPFNAFTDNLKLYQ